MVEIKEISCQIAVMMITHTKVHMYDTDMAGVIFFARQFYHIHEAIEELFEKVNLPFAKLFADSEFVFVIVHAEADYHQPLAVGDPLLIQTTLGKIGTTSLALHFTIYRNQQLVGKGKVVQVCLSRVGRKKCPIPPPLVDKLRDILE